MKNYYVVNDYEKVIKLLVKKFGVPRISSNITIYSRSKSVIIEISMVNNTAQMRIYNLPTSKKDNLYKYFRATDPILIENRNLKYIFKTMHNLGVRDANLTKIIKLEFINGHKRVFYERDTLLGDLVSSDENIKIEKYIKNHIKDTIPSNQIEKLIRSKRIKKTNLFDRLGNINPTIQHNADIYGINLSLNKPNLETALNYKSNDYSELEDIYKIITGTSIVDTAPTKKNNKIFKPISIIIPTYNSASTINKTLLSIESQKLSDEEKHNIEVIVVDDGSDERVSKLVNRESFTYDLKIVRLEKNMGLSNARNTGASLAKHDYLIFIDSDILLSDNYIYEHNLRLQTLPDSIFVSLKNNIKKTSYLAQLPNIKKGLPVPETFNDKRLFRQQKINTPWINKITSDGIYEILSETNYFKNFGNGRIINGYDLPSAVVGHNLSMKKNVFNKVGGFSNSFIGWGLEDTLFGAHAIANGSFIIPVLACGVYHIDHPIRQKNSLLQKRQLKLNINTYKKKLQEYM